MVKGALICFFSLAIGSYLGHFGTTFYYQSLADAYYAKQQQSKSK